jgi:hypothetical protein
MEAMSFLTLLISVNVHWSLFRSSFIPIVLHSDRLPNGLRGTEYATIANWTDETGAWRLITMAPSAIFSAATLNTMIKPAAETTSSGRQL